MVKTTGTEAEDWEDIKETVDTTDEVTIQEKAIINDPTPLTTNLSTHNKVYLRNA